MHALAALDVHDATIVARADLPATLVNEDPVWLLSAGAVPQRASFPPASATGRPLIALGATRTFEGAFDPAWASFLRETGGCLDRKRSPIPSLSSVYAERASVAAPLFADACRSAHAQRKARIVHVPALDVAISGRLRVVLVVTTLHRGGAERVAIDLFHELPSRGVDVVLCVFDPPKRETYEAPPGTIFLYEHHRTRRERVAALVRGARIWGADMVHTHLLDTDEIGALRATGLRVVTTAHNARAGWPAGYEIPGNGVDLLFGCSLATTRELRSARPDALVRTAWNGVVRKAATIDARSRVRQSLGIAAAAHVLVSVANPRPQKRTERLVDALSILVTRGHDAHLLLVGGNVGANHAANNARVDFSARVHTLGTQTNVHDYLAAGDVFVSASDYEGLSLAHLEASGAGLPLVLSRVGGTEEVATMHNACFRLEKDASASLYADAIEKVVTEKTSGTTTSELGASFTRGAMADRHAALYGRIVTTGVRRARQTDVVLVTNNFSTGGAQSSARRLLGALRDRGCAVRAAVIEEQLRFPTPGREALERAGVRVHVAPRAGVNDPRTTAEDVAHLIDETSPRAVVFWNVIPEHKVLLADMLLGVPLFDVSPGEMYFRSLERYFAKPRVGLPYLTAPDYGALLSGVVVKYGAEQARASDLLQAAVHVIPNGVHVPSVPPPRRSRARTPGDVVIVGTLARIGPEKKLEELIDAFRIARPHLPPCALHVAGSAEMGCEDYARELANSSRDLGSAIAWVGERVAAEFLAEVDLFALVAEPAGCPNASLEAMASALPVVATDVGGMREQVVPGETGFLAPRGDPHALAEALVRALRDTDFGAMGLAGFARAKEHFSLERMAQRYAETFGI